MKENQSQDNPQNHPEKISEFKPQKRSKLKVILSVLGTIIIILAVSFAVNYFLSINGSYPSARICSQAGDCADYCPNNHTPLCSEKPVEENDTRSIFERLTAGELNFIDIFMPNQQYCACEIAAQGI
jgi:hypothetical protein